MILDAGCGSSKTERRRKGIGVDLHKGTCDIVADLENLPFRSNVFSFVYARNVLEHLSNPIKGLLELKRVMKSNAKISITIPVHHNLCMDELIKFVVNFPLRTPRTVKRLINWRRHKGEKGFLHQNRICIKEISKVFYVVTNGYEYPSYYMLKALQKCGLLNPNLRSWTTPHLHYIIASTHATNGAREHN